MALSAREVTLILRARDEASRVLRGLSGNMRNLDRDTMRAAQSQMARGEAMSSIGAGIALAGGAAIAFFKDSVDAAIDFNKQAALTQTQTDKVKVSIEGLKNIAKDVAMSIPAPFEQMQSMLYDIFSSMDVNVPESKKLLTEFSKAAVAGNVDLQDAGRATIAILNAYKLPASQVNRVNDVMFQLVRKGVGTYGEFSKAIGRAIPSSARAGQNVEQLAGMMAFLTRNGLTANMAATSAARAFDALSNPKSVEHFKDIGINVRKANGEFKPMNVVMTELGKKMAGLTAPQRAKAMHELFLGSGGTIQARRFFDLAVTNFDELNQRVGEMKNSSGAMKSAYDIMFKQPQTQVQLLSNNFAVLKTVIGDALIPGFVALTGALIKVVSWFNNLDPSTRKILVIAASLTATITVLAGVVTMIAGGFLMLSAAATMAGTALAPLLITIGLVIAAIVAIGAAIFLIIKYHSQIWAFMVSIWNSILGFLKGIWAQIWAVIGPSVMMMVNGIKAGWTAVYSFIATYVPMIWNFIRTWFTTGVTIVTTIITTIFNVWKAIWTEIWFWVGPILKGIWAVVSTMFKAMYQVVALVMRLIWMAIAPTLTLIAAIFRNGLAIAAAVVKAQFNVMKMLVVGGMKVMWAAVKGSATIIVAVLKGAWTVASAVTRAAWTAIKVGIINPIRAAYAGAKANFSSIVASVRSAWASAKAATSAGWNAVRSVILSVMRAIVAAVHGNVNQVVSTMNSMRSRVVGAVSGAAGWLVSAGRNIIQGLVNGMGQLAGAVAAKARSIASSAAKAAMSALKIGSPSKVFAEIGQWIGHGLILGMQGTYKQVVATANTLATKIRNAFIAMYQNKSNKRVAALDKTIRKYRRQLADLKKRAKKHKGLADDVKRAQKRLDDAMDRRKTIAPRSEKEAIKFAAREYKRHRGEIRQLGRYATARATMAARIKATQKSLTDQLKARSDMYYNVRDQARSFASITTTETRGLSRGTIVGNMMRRLQMIRRFNYNIYKLQKAGINKSTLNDIIQAGPEQGLALTQALMKGGATAIRQVNSVQYHIDKESNRLGYTASRSMYQAGIDATTGLLRGLQSQDRKLAAAAKKLAERLAKEVRKALGIKSPSKVFKWMGKMVGAGFIEGINGMAPRVSAAAGSMMNASPAPVDFGGRRPGTAGAAAYGGTNINVHQTIHTQEINPTKHAADLGWAIARAL